MRFLILIFTCLLVTSASSAINGGSTHAQHVNKTTTFLEVIKTDDVEARDAIYMTPAVVMIGRYNGDILRCLQADLNECEVFHKSGSFVRSFVITGKYLYIGLDGGEILRCELNTKESCKTLHGLNIDVHALVVAGGYLYAGLYSGTIFRCDLNLPDRCWQLRDQFGEPQLYSLIQFKEFIYAGSMTGRMTRYSIRADGNYTPVYNMTSGIMGFSSMGDSFYAITGDGRLWKCSHESDSATKFCEFVVKTDYNVLTAIAQFSDMLYLLNEEGLHVCKRENLTSCSNFEHHKDSWSIAFVYATYHMQSRYNNEHSTCSWQSSAKCPPFVTYYDVQDRDMLEVNVVDGKLVNAQGFLVDTSNADEGHNGRAAIFAMGPDGRILLSNSHKRELLHTSSLFAGGPVSGAGEMVVDNGVIVKIKACSEHYRLDADMNKQVIQSLLAQGYKHSIDSSPCDDDYEKTESSNIQ